MNPDTATNQGNNADLPQNENIENPTVIDTIKALQAKTVDGKSLGVSTRRACVEYFGGDGYSVPEIAAILNVSEKTISRDRKAIQESHALEVDPKLIPQIVGRLVREAEVSIDRIRRAARDKEARTGEKTDASYKCFQIYRELVQTLQGLGYLPTAAQRIEASLKHQLDDLPPTDDLIIEVERMRLVAAQAGDQETTQKLDALLKTTARVNLAQSIGQVTAGLFPTEVSHATGS